MKQLQLATTEEIFEELSKRNTHVIVLISNTKTAIETERYINFSPDELGAVGLMRWGLGLLERFDNGSQECSY